MGLLIALLLTSLASARAFIAYDCGAHNTNITTISLLKVKPCQIEARKPIIQETHVRLLQLARYREVQVKTCKITLDRTILNCGMWSHNSLVHNGLAQYLINPESALCNDMHQHKTYRYDDTVFTDLVINGTKQRPFSITGKTTSDGKCEGGSFSDNYGSWANVVVQGKIFIELHAYNAAINIDEDLVYLRHGRRCPFSSGECEDNDGSIVTWPSMPHTGCNFDQYDVLYDGPAQKIYDNSPMVEDVEEVYTVKNGEITFGLAKRGIEYVCDFTLIRTEHPKLFFLETKNAHVGIVKKPISVNNLDLMSYVNSKFVYVANHFGKQLRDLYIDVITQRCTLERQVIENSLLIAPTRPAEFALRIMKQRGYMARIAGEVAHIVQCVPVPVKIAHLETCYAHLPVMVKNQTMFVTPNTHILLKRSPKVDCNAFIAPMYDINGTWVRFSPFPIPVMGPQEMEPLTKLTWSYETMDNLATSGIYSQSDLTKLQDHLMFTEERVAVLDSLARSSLGEKMNDPDISFANMLDEQSLEKIALRTRDKLWGWFTGFGTASAGLIGLYIFARTIKYIIDTLLHGFALHSVFGWSLLILGAFWDSLSNFLLHFKKKIDDNFPQQKGKEIDNVKIPEDERKMNDTPEDHNPSTRITIEPTEDELYPNLANCYKYPGIKSTNV